MKYVYKTKGTCSTLIELEGLTVEQVEQKIGGISCNGRGTSCGDQLAKACREAYEAEQK